MLICLRVCRRGRDPENAGVRTEQKKVFPSEFLSWLREKCRAICIYVYIYRHICIYCYLFFKIYLYIYICIHTYMFLPRSTGEAWQKEDPSEQEPLLRPPPEESPLCGHLGCLNGPEGLLYRGYRYRHRCRGTCRYRYVFWQFKRGLQSVQVLFSGIEAVVVFTLKNLKQRGLPQEGCFQTTGLLSNNSNYHDRDKQCFARCSMST